MCVVLSVYSFAMDTHGSFCDTSIKSSWSNSPTSPGVNTSSLEESQLGARNMPPYQSTVLRAASLYIGDVNVLMTIRHAADSIMMCRVITYPHSSRRLMVQDLLHRRR